MVVMPRLASDNWTGVINRRPTAERLESRKIFTVLFGEKGVGG